MLDLKLKRLDKKYKEENFICIPIMDGSREVDDYINHYRKLGYTVQEQWLLSEIWLYQ